MPQSMNLDNRARKRPRLGPALVSAGIALTVATLALAASGAFERTKHADSHRGVRRLPDWPAGSCEQCHDAHETALPNDFGLFSDADNSTCLAAGCHSTAYIWPPGDYHSSWPGDGAAWSQSAHGYSQHPYPPADGRPVSYCVQCHDPHGAIDPAAGLLPSATRQLEERGCLGRPGDPSGGCHGSDVAYRPSGARDLASLFQRPFRHDIAATTKVHSWDWSDAFPYGKERRTIHSGDFEETRRHVECVDCHNPHTALPGRHVPGESTAGPSLQGAWGVEPVYGPAWSIPTSFSVVEIAGWTGNEHHLCFKCHSFFAYGNTPPPGSTDQAREFNPANLSFHPVVGEIPSNSYTSPSQANGSIETMEEPWANGRHDRMTCSDCHTSGLPDEAAGPHGSFTEGILPEPAGESDNGFCLRCHRASVYAPGSDPENTETGSRFDEQTTGDDEATHYFHVVEEGVGCRQCHGGRQAAGAGFTRGSIHGTSLFSGFMNGTRINQYLPGRCISSCHGREDYTAGPE